MSVYLSIPTSSSKATVSISPPASPLLQTKFQSLDLRICSSYDDNKVESRHIDSLINQESAQGAAGQEGVMEGAGGRGQDAAVHPHTTTTATGGFAAKV